MRKKRKKRTSAVIDRQHTDIHTHAHTPHSYTHANIAASAVIDRQQHQHTNNWDEVNDRRRRLLGNTSHVIVAISVQTQLVDASSQSAASKMPEADPSLLVKEEKQPDPQLLPVNEEKQADAQLLPVKEEKQGEEQEVKQEKQLIHSCFRLKRRSKLIRSCFRLKRRSK